MATREQLEARAAKLKVRFDWANKTVMDWVNERIGDPEGQALMTEIDVRQDLIALREARGVTQVQLAQKLGVNQPVISKLESRGTMDVKLSTLVKVAAALNARVRITIEPIDP